MNWSAVKVKTSPSREPVSVAEVKQNLRLDTDEQDALIRNLITASREAIETRLHRTLMQTTYTQYLDKFPKVIELYRPPVSSVTSIKYYDSNGDQQTWDSAEYIADLVSLPPRIVPAVDESYPTIQSRLNCIEIEFVAGYGINRSDVPEAIRQAIIMLTSDIYEHPEASVELMLYKNRSFKFLLSAYNVPELGE